MLANFSNLITFSRGSNATVTDASGRLTYAANNLLTNSETFEAATWTKGGVTVTANSAAAPDGTTTADKLVENTSTSSHYASQTVTIVSGAIYANSVYAKADGRNWVCLEGGSGAGGYSVWFNLATGAVGTVSGTAVSNVSISDAGNGWYRCSVLDTTTSTTGAYRIFVCDADNNQSYTGDGTSGILVWGAQLEAVTYQTTPSPYVSTSVANLIGFSEAFDNAAWAKTRASIIPNAAQNPINNLWNAQKLMEDTTASNSHFMYQTATVVANTRYVQSVYAKAGERNWMWMTEANNVTAQAYFDLANGVVGTVSGTGSPTAAITPVGNGWYRCSLAFTPIATSANVQVRLANGNGSGTYTGDGNSGIYIYGAQLSNSGSLDPYVPTPGAAPSSTAYYGPRFDYDPVTLAAKGILIEEQRTNLLTYSEQFDNAAWLKFNATVTANSLASLDGTADADTVVASAGAGYHYTGQRPAVSASTVYTASIYVKAGTTRYIGFGDGGDAAWHSAYLDTTNGAILNQTNCTATATAVGNGWFRVTSTFTRTNAGYAEIYVGGSNSTNNTAPNFTATGTETCYAYGAQFEAGAFATSYIPTVASQVTRSADVASITGSLFNGWYNQDQGTITFSGTSLTVSGFSYAALASDTTNNNRFGMYRSSATFSGLAVSGGVTQMDIAASSATANVPFKMAVAAQANNGNFCFNNVLGTTDTSVTMPTVTRLDIGCFGSGSQFNGYIQNITYYPTRLTNDQLQAITK